MRSRCICGLLIATSTALAVASAGAGCSRDDDAVRGEAQRLSLVEGNEALRQAERLARHGRRALPAIEATLHTADEAGRKNLVVAMRRIGDADAVPLLLHIAAYDSAEGVRREAEWTLKTWAQAADAAPENASRAERARAAVRRLDELRGREEAG